MSVEVNNTPLTRTISISSSPKPSVVVTEDHQDITVSMGIKGEPGQGVPTGGSVGDILYKTSSTNYATAWTDVPTVDGVQFDLTANDSAAIGKLLWNDTDGTVDFLLKGGNVNLPTGQATIHMVVNKTGADIPRGSVVAVNGASGQRVGIKLAQSNAESTSSKTFGVTAEEIRDNHTGFVLSEGFIRNINTNTLTEGALIWLSPTVPGGMTTTKPTAPNHLVLVGVCVVQANNGIIFIKPQNGYELEEIHDVRYTGLATGDLLTRTSSNLWENISRSNLRASLAETTAGYTTSTPVLARVSGQTVTGASTSFTVTHNLGTRDVVVQTYNAATYDPVSSTVVRTTINTVTVTFGSAPGADSYRVVITG